MDLTVVVPTFGHVGWADLAMNRAIPSASDQAHVIWSQDNSLHRARSKGLERVRTEWVVFLDADDELAPGYVEAIERSDADVRAPMVEYVPGGPWQPRVAGHTHDCVADCLLEGNWAVVGSAVRTEMLRYVGAWRDWPVYEDYDLFLRCYLSGASFELVRDAVYVAHVRDDSRNRGSLTQDQKDSVYRDIRLSCGVEGAT